MRQFLFFILFCLSTASYCQHTPLYQLRFYTTENGLPSNGIKGLEWDEKSKFLWIGTEAGIVRFNGIDFKVFSKANLPGSNLERVANMVRNDENKIYAFDLENKIYTVTNHNITFSTIENNAILSRINKAIAPALFDKKITEDILEISKKFTLYHLAKIVTTQNGDCYILDELKKLHRFPSSKSNTAYSVMTNQFKNLFKVADKNILLSKDNSFHLINDSLTFNTTTITLEHTNGQKFNITPKHKIYWSNGMSNPILVFENNAWLLSFENNCIKAKIICTQVPTNSLILFIQYDLATKTLFIGTESKGIIIISENKVQSIKNKIASNNSRNAYYSQVKLDTTIILTNEGHTITKSKGSSISNPFKEVFGYRTSLTSDSVFWVTTKASDKKGNNLFSYNSNTRQVKEYRNIKNINFANICKLNNTYYITTALGIGKIIADSVFYLHKYASPLHVSNEPFDLTQHNNTSLLYATCKNIIQYNIESNTLDTLFTSNDYCIRTLHKYNDYYFAGTYGGGYFIYKKGVTKPMPLDKNNFLLHTHCFVIDAKGYCWLSTNRGLFKAKLDDIINAYEKNSAFVYYHYLGKNDGMEITELNGGCSPCALQLNANTISFPSMDGLLWTNPNSENLQLPDGNVYIDNFIINDKTFFSTDTSSIR
ncbi:MAG: hypothetical protein KA319_06875, partial [Ferruginibacter sp.]|nr:hypothetical protein [Ferruginibacter sp.]